LNDGLHVAFAGAARLHSTCDFAERIEEAHFTGAHTYGRIEPRLMRRRLKFLLSHDFTRSAAASGQQNNRGTDVNMVWPV
jgi:hypothetical protein